MPQTIRSRLNRIYGTVPAENTLRRQLHQVTQRSGRESIRQFLGGEWKKRSSGTLLRVERRFESTHQHGGIPLSDLSQVDSSSLRLLAGGGFEDFDPERALFFDTETTGLAGGAGTCIFLVGVAYFEQGQFVIRQLFLPGYESEKALLEDLNDLVCQERFQHLVTFNGKSYDLNLLENRCVMQRLGRPFEDFDHLDLLHTSRLLWRGCFRDCALQTLERGLLGLRRQGDIPSALIPGIYFSYLHSGRYQAFDRVFEHNRQDLLTLVSLMTLASRLVENPDEAHFVDALTASRVHQLRGNFPRALELLEKAYLEAGPQPSSELLFRLALLRKRQGNCEGALELLLPLTGRDSATVEAFEEAAKILEHERHDFAAALGVVDQAMRRFRNSDLEHRKHRLCCRLEGRRWY